MNGSISDTNRSADALWAAVARLVGSEYELAGELSTSSDGRRTAYVATRQAPGRELALLVVERGTTPDAYELSFHEVLDETVPAQDLYCRHCATRLETWAAACPACGQNTSLATAVHRGQASDLSIRSAVVSALGADSVPLGQLPTASGSLAIFARAGRTGEIVALTLERIGGATGPTRAVPIVRLHRHGVTVETPPGAPPTAPKRASSPHSGEIGPLPERDRSLVTEPTQPATLPLVCPHCGSRFEAGARFCPVDGAELRASAGIEDLVGRTIGGKFRVERLLGQGGMGRVYLAEHVRIGRRCALKVLAPNLVGDPSSIRRFALEARNASRIVHPNVAVVYDFEESSDGLVYLVLEFVEGETLGAILGRSENQRLAVDRSIRIARDVADALHAAHELGIVHRDLKPDNIMIAQNDAVKVVDFGIAKAMEGTEGPAQKGVTRTGFVVGTPRYMSPEQLVGTNVDARSDVYSLGCVLYEMVTGRPAYDAPITTERTLRQQPKFREDAPRALDAIITRAMARTAEGRYQTARELRDALDALLAKKRAASRRTLFTRIGIGALVLAAASAAALVVSSRRSSPPPSPAATPPSASQPAAPAVQSPPPSTPTPAPSAPVVAAAGTTPAPSIAVKPKPTPAHPTLPTSTEPSPTVSPIVPRPPDRVAAQESTTSAYLGRPVQYLMHVKQVVREQWLQALEGARPTGAAGQQAEFVLAMDQTGRVTQVKPIAVSNQPAYDDPIESALQRIISFGPPPPRVGSDVHVVFRGFSVTVQSHGLSTPTALDR